MDSRNYRMMILKTKLAKENRHKTLKTLGVIGGASAAGWGVAKLMGRLLAKSPLKHRKLIALGLGASLPAGALLALIAHKKKEKLIHRRLRRKR